MRLEFPASGLVCLCFAAALHAQVDVTTYHYDIQRTGQNTQETTLTPSNVNSRQFGKLFSVALDGLVFAQPLYLSNVSIGGAAHNVLYVATEHDSVYAIDADDGTIYWHVNLIPAGGRTLVGETDIAPGCIDIVPEIGITGTPVIDPATGTLYVVAVSVVGGRGRQALHALDVVTAAEKFGGPVAIAASVAGDAYDSAGGEVTFNPLFEHQRAGLLLENGHVLIGWGSHCDIDPWHGWVMSYDSRTLAQEGVFNTSPNGPRGGVWMSGGGLAADPVGNVYFSTGNGLWDGVTDFGDSVIKLGPPSGGALPVVDYFTPWNQSLLYADDVDMASGGIVLLPTLPSGRQLLAQMGKLGTIYVLDRNAMGGYCPERTPSCTASNPQIVQEIVDATTGIWGSPAYWNGNLYWAGVNDAIKAFSYDVLDGAIYPVPTSKSAQIFAFGAPTPTISANGNADGILWALDGAAQNWTCNANANCLGLYAYDAANLQNLLYDSTQAANNRDSPGSAVKFAVPIIANGKVYVGGQYLVTAYGLFAPAAAAPALSPAPGVYSGAQTVSLTDATVGAAVHYTLDGTVPTAASPLYVKPLLLGTTTTLRATAIAEGLNHSLVSGGTYVIGEIVPAASPVLSPASGTYAAVQTLTITDSTPSATIFYTTDGATPTTASAIYGGPVPIGATTTVKAMASANGYSTSPVSAANYTIDAQVGPAATVVNLAPDANVYSIAEDGTPVSKGGLDYSGNAYSAKLLGQSVAWAGSSFALGAAGTADAVRIVSIPLPPGSFSTLNLLAAATDGNLPNQVFELSYTDGTTASFTQSLSDWTSPQNYPGETVVAAMAYRLTASGAPQSIGTYLYGYSFTIDPGKTVRSLRPPANWNLAVLAVDLLPTRSAAVPVDFSPEANVYGIVGDGAGVPHGGVDFSGHAYSEDLLGTSISWSGSTFALGSAGVADGARVVTIPLPPGNYSSLRLLAAGVNGNQPNQSFTVKYADGSTTAIAQSMSGWLTPQAYAGESTVLTMPYRVTANGTTQKINTYLYGYSFGLDATKTAKSLVLPADWNTVVMAVDLLPGP